MASVGRLAGALLAVTGEHVYLVGNTKTPCDWATAGFATPATIDAVTTPWVRLTRGGAAAAAVAVEIEIDGPRLQLDLEGEALPRLLAEVFLIPRNGSVSERLWRLVTGQRDEDDGPVPEVVVAGWLAQMPPPVWQIVRDTVLRCT